MNINIDLDLASIITAAVSTERIQPLVDKAIMEALKRAIDDATSYRSAFSDTLKKQLADALPHGLSIEDTAKFQQVLNASLTNAVHTANNATIQTAMRKAIDYVVPDVPSTIALSEFMMVVREGLRKEKHESFFAELEISSYGYAHLSFDREVSGTSKYGSDFSIDLNKEGEVYAMRMNGKDLTPKSLPNVISQFDGLLMAMYVGRTALVIDIDADDVSSIARGTEEY
jgi:hypothetical protein